MWKFAKQGGNNQETDTVPMPSVLIDQDSDPDATIVEVTFGDRLGALLDTVWRHPFSACSVHTTAYIGLDP